MEQSFRRPKIDSARRAGSEVSTDPNEFAITVGGSIRSARQGLGWTQAQLAESADLSVNYVARLERGELGPSLFVASRLASALGVPLETLVSGKSSPRGTGKRRIAQK